MTDLRDQVVDDPAQPYPVKEPESSLGDLAGRLTTDMGALLSDHLQLARVEITADVKAAAKGAGLLGASAAAGWIAALVLSMAAAWGLAEALDSTWLGFLIVGGVWAVAAAVMAAIGKQKIDEVDPVPSQTMDELERDKQWINEQRN